MQNSGTRTKDLDAVKRLLVRSGRKLPSPLKSTIRRLVPKKDHSSPPTLSIVIPVFNVKDYVEETLDSLVEQTLTDWEAIVVDDGSTDGSGGIVDRYAKTDSRIKVVHQKNSGLGAARNRGTKSARGKYLTFLDSDDIIPPKAYEITVATLEETGSDFAIGGVDRLKDKKRYTPPFTRIVHAKKLLKTTANAFPDVVMDVIACNRIFRTDFWRSRIGSFPENVAYEDHRVMVAALARAESIDILPQTTYVWRIRDNNSSISQQKADIQNLIDCIKAKDETFEILRKEATPSFVNAWITRMLDGGVPIFAPFALLADDTYRSLLKEHAAKYVDLAQDVAWNDVRWDSRVKTLLIAQGKWQALGEFQVDLRINGGMPVTVTRDESVHLEMGAWPHEISEALQHHTTLGHRQTQLIARLTSAQWSDSGLSAVGFCYISHLHQDLDCQVDIALVNERTGKTIDVGAAELDHSDYASRYANHRNFDYTSTGVRFTVAWRTIIEHTQDHSFSNRDRLRLVARKRVGGVYREGTFDTAHRAGSGSVFTHAKLPTEITSLSVVPHRDVSSFSLQFKSINAELLKLDTSSNGLCGRIMLAEGLDKQPETVYLETPNGRVQSPLQHDPEDSRHYLFADLQPHGTTSTRLKVRFADGSSRALTWALESSDILLFETAAAYRSPFGYIDLQSNAHGAVVGGVEFNNSVLTLKCSYFGLDRSAASRLQIVKDDQSFSFAPSSVKLYDSEFEVSFDFSSLAVRTSLLGGTFHLIIDDFRLTPQPSLTRSMPATFLTPEYRIELSRGSQAMGRPLLIKFAGPLNHSEIGVWNQQQLRRWYRETEFTAEGAVLFQCYRGESASDNQLSIFNELATRDTALTFYWGVADGRVKVPEGARPVVIGTKEWYRVLGSSRYLCNNIDFDSFFVRRDYQNLLSTFHGHPFKSMGRTFWESKNYNSFQVAYEVQRRKDAWTSALMPNLESVQYYKDEYDYNGDFAVTGYPRNDPISNNNVENARQRVAATYGLAGDSRKWVLYAPTWREASATGSWSAKMFDDLDLNGLATSLGSDWTVLVRGHGYNSRESARVERSASIVDVTDYPDINDLILASDVAVLDYSSLRFDWAITKKPMIFFVPDKEEYFSLRPCLFDYDDSAPGAQTTTTEDTAIEILKHNEYLNRFGPQLQKFNLRFNRLNDGKAASRVVDHFFKDVL